MNDQNNKCKVALVTGIAPGLGDALYHALSTAGFHVVGLARSDRMRNRLKDAGVSEQSYTHYQCDLTDSDAVMSAVREIEQQSGPIEVLSCNAHQLMIKPFTETSAADLESVWKNTCFSAMSAAQAVLPHMISRSQGTIIFTGATAAIRGGAKFSAFASAKFALRGFAQALAREHGPDGIHIVHTILDGLIWEEQTRERFNPPEAKCISPEAIANAYVQMIEQDRSAWTHELDLRPFSETF